MKQFKYAPQLKDDAGNLIFTGTVTIDMPKYKDRLALVKEVNFKVENGEISTGADQIDSMIKLAEIVEKHVKEIDLKVKDYELKSFEDLQYNKSGSDLINELGNVLLSGMTMGKI